MLCLFVVKVVLSGGIKHITCLEDDEFINALDKAMSEDIQVHFFHNRYLWVCMSLHLKPL